MLNFSSSITMFFCFLLPQTWQSNTELLLWKKTSELNISMIYYEKVVMVPFRMFLIVIELGLTAVCQL